MRKRVCKVEGCNNRYIAKGYCGKHYQKFKKYGDPLYFEVNMDRDPICTIDGCNNPHEAKGYCHKHYVKYKKYDDPLYRKHYREIESHGMRNTPEYSVWCGMKQRCYNPKTDRYPHYGGRGITVCDKWLHSFIAFYADMGDRPTDKHQIDRTDNDGNYEPGNCRWLTVAENCQNRSNTKLDKNKVIDIRAKNKTGKYSNKDLASEYNVHKDTIRNIVNNAQWIML